VKIKVLLARSEELWWDGLSRLLVEINDIEIAGITTTAVDTIRLASQIKPDVILLDEEISEGNCGEVIRDISEIHPETNTIVIIKPYKNVNVSAAFKARAKAFIDKDVSLDELIRAIRYVAKGGIVVISPIVAQQLLEQVATSTRGNSRVRPEYDIGLSNREIEVLRLVSQGITNKEIAEALVITENTVKTHLGNILEKMQVRNRQQAAALAREMGYLESPK
jgi:DNA-binding NarL/FixJ family response regulator